MFNNVKKYHSLDDVINLLGISYTENEYGDTIETPTERPVFCSVKSISKNEYYQSQTVGLQPELIFVLHSQDYQNEQKLVYESRFYEVIRVYKNDEYMELTCKRGVLNGTT